jgi:hypothetical protein
MPTAWQIHRDHCRRQCTIREWSILSNAKPPSDPEEEKRLAELAKTFPVTRLPYKGEKRALKFNHKRKTF